MAKKDIWPTGQITSMGLELPAKGPQYFGDRAFRPSILAPDPGHDRTPGLWGHEIFPVPTLARSRESVSVCAKR
jgi:hypothetical protein